MQKFWDKVKKSDGCWEWTASKRNGYGQMTVKEKHVDAHRMSYILHHGAIPEGKVIDHLCKNKGCVNPMHLEAVTYSENSNRGFSGMKTHCLRGHAFTEENTRWVTRKVTSRPQRQCRACDRLQKRVKRGVPETEFRPHQMIGNTLHCKQGHEWNDINSRIYKGNRICRICEANRKKNFKKNHGPLPSQS